MGATGAGRSSGSEAWRRTSPAVGLRIAQRGFWGREGLGIECDTRVGHDDRVGVSGSLRRGSPAPRRAGNPRPIERRLGHFIRPGGRLAPILVIVGARVAGARIAGTVLIQCLTQGACESPRSGDDSALRLL